MKRLLYIWIVVFSIFLIVTHADMTVLVTPIFTPLSKTSYTLVALSFLFLGWYGIKNNRFHENHL